MREIRRTATKIHSILPQRSPLDNLTFSIGVSYRFNKSGFTEWNNRPPKRDKNKEVFNYKGVTK